MLGGTFCGPPFRGVFFFFRTKGGFREENFSPRGYNSRRRGFSQKCSQRFGKILKGGSPAFPKGAPFNLPNFKADLSFSPRMVPPTGNVIFPAEGILGKPKTINLYSWSMSVQIQRDPTLGHARGAVIGDALCRLGRHLGYK